MIVRCRMRSRARVMIDQGAARGAPCATATNRKPYPTPLSGTTRAAHGATSRRITFIHTYTDLVFR